KSAFVHSSYSPSLQFSEPPGTPFDSHSGPALSMNRKACGCPRRRKRIFNKPGARGPRLQLHTAFHATLNDPVQTDNRNQRRVDVQPPTDSESHSMWWSRNEPSQ